MVGNLKAGILLGRAFMVRKLGGDISGGEVLLEGYTRGSRREINWNVP